MELKEIKLTFIFSKSAETEDISFNINRNDKLNQDITRQLIAGDSFKIKAELRKDELNKLNLDNTIIKLVMTRSDLKSFIIEPKSINEEDSIVEFVINSNMNGVSNYSSFRAVAQDSEDEEIAMFSDIKKIFINPNSIINQLNEIQDNTTSLNQFISELEELKYEFEKLKNDFYLSKEDFDKYMERIDKITISEEYLKKLEELVKLIEESKIPDKLPDKEEPIDLPEEDNKEEEVIEDIGYNAYNKVDEETKEVSKPNFLFNRQILNNDDEN